MAKKPRTRQGMALRKTDRAAFNPANGEPHTARHLKTEREFGRRRSRRVRYATAAQ